MNTVEPIRDKRDVYAIKKYLRQKDIKYYIMFITGISLGLRINEILKMTLRGVLLQRSGRARPERKSRLHITMSY